MDSRIIPHDLKKKKSLPISQHIWHICSSDTDFKKQTTDLEHRFLQRGYKREWVTQAFSHFSNLTQSECLNTTGTTTRDNRITCAFSTPTKMSTIIKKHWHVIATDPALKRQPTTGCFQKTPKPQKHVSEGRLSS